MTLKNDYVIEKQKKSYYSTVLASYKVLYYYRSKTFLFYEDIESIVPKM